MTSIWMRLSSLAFGLGLIALLAWLLAYFDGADLLDSFSSLEILFGSFFFLGALLASPARVLLGFWAGFFDFGFSSSKVLLLLDDPCLSSICTLSNIGFLLKFGRKVVVLEVISS